MSRTIKRLACVLLAPVIAFSLPGCWDYRGLDTLSVVAGIAVDACEDGVNQYDVTFEVVDMLMASEEEEFGTTKLKSSGRTIMECVNNANRQLRNQMYFGNTELLLVGEAVARKNGLGNIIEALLRDFNTRKNVLIVVSREETAGDILDNEEDKEQITSYYITSNIAARRESTDYTRYYPMFEVYNQLVEGNGNLSLPALRFSDRKAGQITTDGLAVFEQDKLTGFIREEDTSGLMLATQRLHSGSYIVRLDEGDAEIPQYVSLTMIDTKPTPGYRYADGRFTLTLEIEALVRATEVDVAVEKLKSKDVKKLEERANATLAKELTEIIHRTQTEYGADVILFGGEVYKRDPDLWRRVQSKWPELYREAEVEVTCNFTINDTGIIKEYQGNGGGS